MRGRSLLLLMMCTAMLFACATIPPSPLTADAARTLRLDNINVKVAPEAVISWANAENEYVNAHRTGGGQLPPKKITETGAIPGNPNAADEAVYNELVGSEDGKAYVRDKISERVRTAIAQQVKPRMLAGNRPVNLDVTIHSFTVPSAVQRAVIGGVPVMSATAVLRDASTGEVIAERKELIVAAAAGNGWLGALADQFFTDLDVRLANSYAEEYRNWLMPKT
jgi:hypothetical protein